NGEPGSISRSTRSRGRSLPRATWRSFSLSGPPEAASARFCSRSATSARMAAALALNSSEVVETAVLILGMRLPVGPRVSMSAGGERGDRRIHRVAQPPDDGVDVALTGNERRGQQHVVAADAVDRAAHG